MGGGEGGAQSVINYAHTLPRSDEPSNPLHDTETCSAYPIWRRETSHIADNKSTAERQQKDETARTIYLGAQNNAPTSAHALPSVDIKSSYDRIDKSDEQFSPGCVLLELLVIFPIRIQPELCAGDENSSSTLLLLRFLLSNRFLSASLLFFQEHLRSPVYLSSGFQYET